MRTDGDFEDREGHQAPFTLRVAERGSRRTRPVPGRLLDLADLRDDGVEVRPFAGIEFGMEQLAIGADFEGAATRWDEGERRDPIAELENLSRQTDGFRCVVSNAAILDPDFGLHRSLLSAPEISGKGGRVKCRRFALRSAGSILLRRAGPRRPEGDVYTPARLVRPRWRWRVSLLTCAGPRLPRGGGYRHL